MRIYKFSDMYIILEELCKQNEREREKCVNSKISSCARKHMLPIAALLLPHCCVPERHISLMHRVSHIFPAGGAYQRARAHTYTRAHIQPRHML